MPQKGRATSHPPDPALSEQLFSQVGTLRSERCENAAGIKARLGAPGWAGEEGDFFSICYSERFGRWLSEDEPASLLCFKPYPT